jgi:hypothetical protein
MPAVCRCLVVALALAATLAPAAALAKGGGSTPPPPVTQAACDYSRDGSTANGAQILTMPVQDAGCVSIVSSAATLKLYAVTAAHGWTYTVKSNGRGTNSRVEVQFQNPATGARADLRYGLGATVIK